MYIVSAFRSPVGKANRGFFKNTRSDDIGCRVIKHILKQHPSVMPEEIDDLIVGCAMPEAEQGLNIARLLSLMSFNTEKVPAVTVNRYCASGLEAIAMGALKIEHGQADCIVAGGIESMSQIPMGGWKISPNRSISREFPDWYWGMGLTAEEVAKQFSIDREDADEFAFHSHQKAIKAIKDKKFEDEIVPFTLNTKVWSSGEIKEQTISLKHDEGPRQDTSMDALGKLKPAFAKGGSVTAGNSSQTSDGAAFVMLASEEFMKKHNLKPLARFHSYATAGVQPKIMGIGPVYAIPKLLKKTNKTLDDIDLVELNEAFASQSLAVINESKMDKEKINVNGGAISLGHPLGCTGTKLSVQIIHELRKRKKKFGMVTMCVGTGQGAAGLIEVIH